MRYTWIDEYLLSKAGVTKDLQRDWNWIRYQIGGKMFAAICLSEKDEPYYITLKLEPAEGDFLRQQYEDIIPGFYMNKTHWNSIKPDGEVPDNLLKDLLDKSYQLVLGRFSKKKQREILEAAQRVNTIMAFDFKKEYKEFYMPKNRPEIVKIPPMNYVAVRGKENPNVEGGDYQQAISILYAVAYTLKMSDKTDYKIEGFFKYVVPPLEGFWWQEGVDGIDYNNKDLFQWISVIRLPDFVTKKDFAWAVQTASFKKKMDCSKAEFLRIDEGLCVQCMHHGPFDLESATVALMDEYIEEQGYVNDFSDKRLHHEIYMSDARRVDPTNWKTIIRHPIRKE